MSSEREIEVMSDEEVNAYQDGYETGHQDGYIKALDDALGLIRNIDEQIKRMRNRNNV